MAIDQIIDDFAFLDDWEDRYRYVIELGRKLPDFPDALRQDANKVTGCVSQVWLVTTPETANGSAGVLRFSGDSDAMIVRGLIAILLEIYSGRSPQEILAIDAAAIFERLGLRDHLTPQRSNGLNSMVGRIRHDAEQFLAQQA